MFDQTFELKTYSQNLPKGTHTHRFKVALPDWLPATLMDSPVEWSDFKVLYSVSAQFSAQDTKACSKYLLNSAPF